MAKSLTFVPLKNVFFDSPIAHRGLHDCNGEFGSGRSENSSSAFIAAISSGYGIELDIQLSADGVPLVFHDRTLNRLLKINKKVSELDMNILRSLRLPNQEKIPTLDEVLSLVCGKVPILIEMKEQKDLFFRNSGRMEDAVALLLKQYNGPVGVMSFNPQSIKLFGMKLPNVPRGLVTGEFHQRDWPHMNENELLNLRNLSAVNTIAASFVSHEYSNLGSPYLNQIPKTTKIFSWTIRNVAELKLALERSNNVTFEGFLP